MTPEDKKKINEALEIEYKLYTKEEDEAFKELDQSLNRKRQIIERQVIHDLTDNLRQCRNSTLEEVAMKLETMTTFGKDTMDSFAAYVRNMKN
jgi:hypothetical protein